MPEMTSKVAHHYAGRNVNIGERFEVEPEHVAILLAMGRAEAVSSQTGEVAGRKVVAASQPGPYRRRDMAAAPAAKRKYTRTYKRKAG